MMSIFTTSTMSLVKMDSTVPSLSLSLLNAFEAKSHLPTFSEPAERWNWDNHAIKKRPSEFTRPFGGCYMPEALYEGVESLKDAFASLMDDANFWKTFETYYIAIGGPSRIQYARHLTENVRGPRVYLKRDDLKHTGSHSITNALGQALFARRLGKKRIVTDTGSGGHGVATAAVCQMLGLECIVYIGAENAKQCQNQKRRMQAYDAKIVEVDCSDGKLREAANESLRALVKEDPTTYLLLGGANGPDPLPYIVRTFQSFSGKEIRRDMQQITGRLPDAIVACAGAHGSAVGAFSPFIDDSNVALVAVEGAGKGLRTSHHAAVLCHGTPGVFRGTHTLLLQDDEGQVRSCHSVAADFTDPVVSPILSEWTTSGRVVPIAATDSEAIFGRALLKASQNIECSLEDGHAVAIGLSLARSLPEDTNIVICLGSGSTNATGEITDPEVL